ncbi:MAG: hypothetical protein EBV58_05195 [Actinobacteria bacterium]|nr:hypothetical protein [Actinomycetota bacterium]
MTHSCQERGVVSEDSVFDGVAKSSPSLLYSTKLQKRAAEFGFDWPDSTGAADKFRGRFQHVVALAGQRNLDLTKCSLTQLDELWEIAKQNN